MPGAGGCRLGARRNRAGKQRAAEAAQQTEKTAGDRAAAILSQAEQKANLIIEKARKAAEPEAARILAEAEERGRRLLDEASRQAQPQVRKLLSDAEHNARTIIDAAREKARPTAAKIVAEAQSKKILGVHLVGGHVTELVAGATGMIELGADAARLGTTVHPHPTLSEAIMEAAHALCGHAIHI